MVPDGRAKEDGGFVGWFRLLERVGLFEMVGRL